MSSSPCIDDLPDEILLIIFHYIQLRDMERCMEVCTLWSEILSILVEQQRGRFRIMGNCIVDTYIHDRTGSIPFSLNNIATVRNLSTNQPRYFSSGITVQDGTQLYSLNHYNHYRESGLSCFSLIHGEELWKAYLPQNLDALRLVVGKQNLFVKISDPFSYCILIIPIDSPEKWKWWQPFQRVNQSYSPPGSLFRSREEKQKQNRRVIDIMTGSQYVAVLSDDHHLYLFDTTQNISSYNIHNNNNNINVGDETTIADNPLHWKCFADIENVSQIQQSPIKGELLLITGTRHISLLDISRWHRRKRQKANHDNGLKNDQYNLDENEFLYNFQAIDFLSVMKVKSNHEGIPYVRTMSMHSAMINKRDDGADLLVELNSKRQWHLSSPLMEILLDPKTKYCIVENDGGAVEGILYMRPIPMDLKKSIGFSWIELNQYRSIIYSDSPSSSSSFIRHRNAASPVDVDQIAWTDVDPNQSLSFPYNQQRATVLTFQTPQSSLIAKISNDRTRIFAVGYIPSHSHDKNICVALERGTGEPVWTKYGCGSGSGRKKKQRDTMDTHGVSIALSVAIEQQVAVYGLFANSLTLGIDVLDSQTGKKMFSKRRLNSPSLNYNNDNNQINNQNNINNNINHNHNDDDSTNNENKDNNQTHTEIYIDGEDIIHDNSCTSQCVLL